MPGIPNETLIDDIDESGVNMLVLYCAAARLAVVKDLDAEGQETGHRVHPFSEKVSAQIIAQDHDLLTTIAMTVPAGDEVRHKGIESLNRRLGEPVFPLNRDGVRQYTGNVAVASIILPPELRELRAVALRDQLTYYLYPELRPEPVGPGLVEHRAAGAFETLASHELATYQVGSKSYVLPIIIKNDLPRLVRLERNLPEEVTDRVAFMAGLLLESVGDSTVNFNDIARAVVGAVDNERLIAVFGYDTPGRLIPFIEAARSRISSLWYDNPDGSVAGLLKSQLKDDEVAFTTQIRSAYLNQSFTNFADEYKGRLREAEGAIPVIVNQVEGFSDSTPERFVDGSLSQAYDDAMEILHRGGKIIGHEAAIAVLNVISFSHGIAELKRRLVENGSDLRVGDMRRLHGQVRRSLHDGYYGALRARTMRGNLAIRGVGGSVRLTGGRVAESTRTKELSQLGVFRIITD